jgi:polysaccharide pyruvyl transferase WcaK-like protein
MPESTSARSNGAGPTIGLLSPCGWGDLGNFAIIDSLIHGIRERMPGARFVGFTLNPDDTAHRHDIEAHTCAAYSLPFYPVREPGPIDGPAGGDGRSESRRTGLLSAAANRFRSALRRMPVHGALRTWAIAPFRLIHEPGHFARSRERLRGASALVVAGGGQLDAAWGGVLGHPYTLWRWGRLARSVGATYVFASVGTGSVPGISRHVILRALGLAAYRSYRDERSRELLRASDMTARDRIVPDLAYALPFEPTPPPRGGHLIIGLSPMNYKLNGRWPKPDGAQYRRHISSFARLGAHALADGHEVVVFVTDDDGPAIDDTMNALRDLAPEAISRVRYVPTPTVQALLGVLSSLDVAAVARLHGVVLSHVANRPVLAVAHERKVRTLMHEMGQSNFCFDISDFDPAKGYQQLLLMMAERDKVTDQIARAVAENRTRVLEQYDRLFGRSGLLQPSAPSSLEALRVVQASS